jgi:hypothetical protein
MTKETRLTEQESLRIITEMISKARNSSMGTGIGPLTWGILIAFCSLETYAQIEFKFDLSFDVWWLALIALVPQIFYELRNKIQRNFRSHDEVVINYVWVTFVICMFLLSHYASHIQTGNYISLCMILYGVPTFIVGGIKKFTPMIIGGIICWICSFISCYTSIKIGMLLSAVSAISAWLIPGIILRRKYLGLKHV